MPEQQPGMWPEDCIVISSDIYSANTNLSDMAAPLVPYKGANLPRIMGADERNNHFTIEGYWQCQNDPSNVRLKSVGGTASDISTRIRGARNLQLHVRGSPLCLKLNMADVLHRAGTAEFTYTTDANETVTGTCSLTS
ncbi:hypothetical protein LPJ53_001625 [Coemansia erecta]|uniref:Uncharacterized protein n=1 Tax=Coemansia erecta TaxID=147472 RepID=A0A9W7XZM5_9FUNG|nr:hypothetical protein LPJ53_001625 [Coemansia erecta]